MSKTCKKRVHVNDKKNLPSDSKKCPGLLHFTLLRKINVDQFLQKKCNLKVPIFQVNLKHACLTCYINIYAYLFEVQEFKYCLPESL